MDDLTPPLIALIRELRFGLRSGLSLNESLRASLEQNKDEASAHFHELWQMRTRGSLQPNQRQFSGHHAHVLWDLLERGDNGQPIDEPLSHLLAEAERVAEADIERHISLLPFKALIPLLIFQFPAFAGLLIGPLFRELQKHLLVATLIIVGWSARAEKLTATYSKQLTAESSLPTLQAVRKKFTAIRLARQACRIQLLELNVPYACYEALYLEGAGNQSSTQIRLDARCKRASAEFRGLDAGRDRHLSPVCRKAVARARELRSYKSVDTDIGPSLE